MTSVLNNKVEQILVLFAVVYTGLYQTSKIFAKSHILDVSES